nr:TetR/AcrR family transcriptional regulator [Nocardia sp. BMG51109]
MAVERALDDRHRSAVDEVERILAAAVRVMERVAPAAPRLSDIVTEAGSSNKAFYRYFTGKDDLILAVLERGVALVVSYLEHQMAKEATPAGRITRWIEGAMVQVTDPHLISMSRATLGQVPAADDTVAADAILKPLRALLTEPVAALGQPDSERAADSVFHCTLDTMRRYIGSARRPSDADVAHLVRFCLRGAGAPP